MCIRGSHLEAVMDMAVIKALGEVMGTVFIEDFLASRHRRHHQRLTRHAIHKAIATLLPRANQTMISTILHPVVMEGEHMVLEARGT